MDTPWIGTLRHMYLSHRKGFMLRYLDFGGRFRETLLPKDLWELKGVTKGEIQSDINCKDSVVVQYQRIKGFNM